MAFTQRMGDIDLISRTLTGMSSHRRELWTTTLQECKHLFEKKGFSQQLNRKAFGAIDSLQEKGSASTHSPAALSIYRYVGEGLIRSTLSMAYEDKLPFDWSCNWSALALQEVMIRISTFLAPMNLSRRSRLLPHLLISVLASAMDLITHSGADKLSWWKEIENVQSLMRKARKMAKGFSGEKVTEKDKDLITKSSLLFANGMCLLEFMTASKTFSALHNEGIPKLEIILRRRYDEKPTNELVPRFLFMKEKVLEILSLLLDIEPTFGHEMGLWVAVQHNYLDAKEHSDLTNVCRNIVTNENVLKMMSMDNILLDLAFLYSDMFRTISIISSDENEKDVEQLMTVLAEPWQDNKICNHRKLFMLSIALMQGIYTKTVDNSLLVNAIMEKLLDDGTFSSTRKKRTKLNSRQTKRAPKLQPRVIYSRPLSDSEDDYTSRNQRKKHDRSKQRKSRITESDDSEESEEMLEETQAGVIIRVPTSDPGRVSSPNKNICGNVNGVREKDTILTNTDSPLYSPQTPLSLPKRSSTTEPPKSAMKESTVNGETASERLANVRAEIGVFSSSSELSPGVNSSKRKRVTFEVPHESENEKENQVARDQSPSNVGNAKSSTTAEEDSLQFSRPRKLRRSTRSLRQLKRC